MGATLDVSVTLADAFYAAEVLEQSTTAWALLAFIQGSLKIRETRISIIFNQVQDKHSWGVFLFLIRFNVSELPVHQLCKPERTTITLKIWIPFEQCLSLQKSAICKSLINYLLIINNYNIWIIQIYY